MHEHRTIPQRLNEAEAIINEQAHIIVDLLERVYALEQARPAPKPAPKGGA